MKVLHLVKSDYFGGAAVACRRLHSELHKFGHESIVLCDYPSGLITNSIGLRSRKGMLIPRIRNRINHEISKISRYEMMKWRKHHDADNLISTAINYKLEEALGIISCAAPQLCKRLVDIGLSERTRPYTAVDSIKTALAFLQTGVIDRENKSEIKKIRRALEQLEGEPSDIVDI